MTMRLTAGQRGINPRTYAAQQIRKHIEASGLRAGDPLPSYRELARRIKVSLMTVERAMDDLANDNLITCVDRKGAFLARQLGPSTRELRTIGLFSASSRSSLVSTPYRSEILRGLLDRADRLKADIKIFSFRSEQGHIKPTDVVRECDGVVVLGAIHPDVLASFVKEHIPMVVADYATESLPLHHLVCDNAVMVRSAVARLLADRHEQIVYVRGQQGPRDPAFWLAADSDHVERHETFLAIAREHNEAAWPVVELSSAERGLDIGPLVEVLASKQRPTGVIVEGTGFACDVLRELEAQTRLQVPRDLSLVAVAGTRRENIMPGHVVAHHEVRFHEMGGRAVDCLQQRCRSLRPIRRTIERIAADFCPGDTLGAAPART